MREWRIAVTGGRHYGTRIVDEKIVENPEEVVRVAEMLDHFGNGDLVTLIHGGATGADALCAAYARTRGWTVCCYTADWSLGKKAGPIRNAAMVNDGFDLLIAFPGGKGTADMVRRATAAGRQILWAEEEP